ncbi:Putative glycosyltransferase EpsH [Acaryochloris thomasi RCC1774]|uniref:Glycosyltransferase EpsH n=1 Tax=Acaryochloris thomasi RCC1774 TaxID=1764569 RepID=A0A2W1JP68_9CYAN|nr:glycosyltransferase family 2 protein [Acaryochloris thomasi]PZD73225.1 Putative glycosyltransferase EpsH [Acaryochloris thomasi RCC1774]
MTPLVSVCIPTYNASRHLEDCLNSVISQTLTDFEVLVVDNQSSDNTLEIVKSYAERDSRFRIIVNDQNIGAINNFNRCAELAQGEWIKYVHADDLIEPHCLEKLISAKQSDSALVCCRRNFLFEPGVSEKTEKYYLDILSKRSIETLFPDSINISARSFCKATLENIGFNIVGEPVAVILNRNAFYRYGVFNRHIVNKCDVELWTRVATHTGITHVPEVLATHRVHSGSVTTGNTADRHYRKSKIDQLIILYEFVLNPIYAPLRDVAKNYPTVNLQNLLAKSAHIARRIAEKDTSVMPQWEEIQKYYPALSNISKLSFPQKITHYTNRLGKSLEN